MENDVLQRVISLVEYSNLSKKAFAEKIGMEQTTVNNQLIGKRGVSFDLIQNISKTFRDISMDWLIKGESPMIRKNIIHGNNNGINSNEGKIGTFVSGDNHKTVVGNLEINDPGFEKIINENEVEIIGSHEPTVIHLRHEIEILKKENEKLMSESSSKDKIIEAKDQTINILQSFIGKK